jgi:hypothetical protein
MENSINTGTDSYYWAPYIQPNDNYGWICPKCNTVHAPWVSQCNCMNQTYWYGNTPVKGDN